MYSQQGSWKYFYSVYTVRIVFGHTSVVERPVCAYPRVQSVTRIPKKNFILRCHLTDSQNLPQEKYWRQYDRAMSRVQCTHPIGKEGATVLTPVRGIMWHISSYMCSTHTVLSHLYSNTIACTAVQWHSTQSPETSQGLWGQKPYIYLGSTRVPSQITLVQCE